MLIIRLCYIKPNLVEVSFTIFANLPIFTSSINKNKVIFVFSLATIQLVLYCVLSPVINFAIPCRFTKMTTAEQINNKRLNLEKATNFMRQYRDPQSRELKKLSANQFMEVWSHYDKDGKCYESRKVLCV